MPWVACSPSSVTRGGPGTGRDLCRCAAAARGRRHGVFREHGERLDGPLARLRDLGPDPAAVRPQQPRAAVVGQHHLDDRAQPGLGLRVVDGRDRLDAPVEVALHQVGRADVALGARRRWRTSRSASAPGTRPRSSAPGSAPTRPATPGTSSTCRARSGRSATPASLTRVQRRDRRRCRRWRCILMTMRPAPRPRALAASRSISSMNRGRSVMRRDEQPPEARWRESPVRTLNRSVTSAPSSSRQVSSPKSSTAARSCRCSCRSRCGRSGAGRCPRAGRPAPPWSAS